MSDSIWKTLSAIDCSEHIEKKGEFKYLTWTWAWAMVKEKYPRAHYELLPDTVYQDGTVEVRVSVKIGMETFDRNGLSTGDHCEHTMWLPVLDFRNKPIPNPNAFDINTARMRCLVKCLAMFGLGHYIYAGESTPQPAGLSDDEYQQFVAYVAEKNGVELVRYMAELGEDKCNEAYNNAPHGKKVQFKKDVTSVITAGHMVFDQYAEGLVEHLERNDTSGVLELLAELDDPNDFGDCVFVKKQVWGRLSETEKHTITKIIQENK